MLNAISWLFKAALFSAIVLMLGNWITIGNRTVSEQVRIGLSRAERSEVAAKMKSAAESVADQARTALQDARKGATLKPKAQQSRPPVPAKTGDKVAKAEAPTERPNEKIPSSEREKLKALIEELNRPQGRASAKATSPQNRPVQAPQPN